MAQENGERASADGTVSSVVFRNRENGYTVLRVKTTGGEITAVGSVPGVNVGERVRLEGEWTAHPSYGQQLAVDSFEYGAPEGADALMQYLSSGAIKHLGASTARLLVDRFGADVLSVMENEPEKLVEVRGISLNRAREMGRQLRRQAGMRRLVEFFAKYKISPGVAVRAYGDMGEAALEAVRENPYVLAGERYGAQFHEADAMALDLGFEGDCHQRVEAAVIFELAHNLQNGHTFIPKTKLSDAARRMIDVGQDAADDAVEALCETGDIVNEHIAGQDACYLRHMARAESFVAERVTALARARKDSFAMRIAPIIDDLEREIGITYAPEQRRAVELAGSGGIMALTGGPGTGKTTCVRGILALFDALGLKTALCAPTGRAAKRMSELCAREALTVHRLLGAGISERGEPMFERDEADPIDADAVVVDEASMIDISLMRALLAAVKPDARVVIVGDADQLPSVGPGNVLSDILGSGAVPAVALTEIFRQAAQSDIIKNAHMINRGEVPVTEGARSDFFFMRRMTPERINETVVELCSHRLPHGMGIEPSQIQVLAPTRRHESGTYALNEKLREALNPQRPGVKEKKYGDFLYREGDRVMQIKNNYDIMWNSRDGQLCGKGVFNGDVGRIESIDIRRETLVVDFDAKLVAYGFEQLPELEPAFAMTVHKSQGSEYRAVVMALTRGASPSLMSRRVLYTAVTRARELFIAVGDPGAFESMALNDRRYRRYSGLRARLGAGIEQRARDGV
ncbi:MAG: ATP-dependent RecD-like DNA helicase [Oscillospiraceae bacterium]|jgi:exodeoxyribonuclease V alpha subunit|nr:ATP-dependent RecD-like DNA helicase [Oscillospiraceae bacterium]